MARYPLGQRLSGQYSLKYWLVSPLTLVPQIMKRRIASAAEKKCDGVDPDNMGMFIELLKEGSNIQALMQAHIDVRSHRS
jgi:hypothetical protein